MSISAFTLLAESLAEVLGRGDEVDELAADLLVKIGEPAVELLVRQLGNEDSDVRRAAAEVLGRIGDTQAVGPLLEQLDDESSDVREAAAGALEGMGFLKDARAFRRNGRTILWEGPGYYALGPSVVVQVLSDSEVDDLLLIVEDPDEALFWLARDAGAETAQHFNVLSELIEFVEDI